MARSLSPRKERKQLVAKFTQGPTSRSNQSAAQAFAGALKRHGVDTVFGQSIPSLIHLAAPEFGIRQIAYRTENAGGAMADGYARISAQGRRSSPRRTGPAATLLVPPLAEALKASVPVVALVQDVARDKRPQRVPGARSPRAVRAAAPSGCAACTAPIAHRRLCRHGVHRGHERPARPGRAAVPADLLGDGSGRRQRRGMPGSARYPLDRVVADPAQVARPRPICWPAPSAAGVAGGGVHLSDAARELAALQESASLPVATTEHGQGRRRRDAIRCRSASSATSWAPGGMARASARTGRRSRRRPAGRHPHQPERHRLAGRCFPRGARFIHLDVDGRRRSAATTKRCGCVGDAQADARGACDGAAARATWRRGARPRPALERSIAAGRERASARKPRRCSRSDARPIRPERLMARSATRADAGRDVVSPMRAMRRSGSRTTSPARGAGHALPHAARPRRARLGPAAGDRREGGARPSAPVRLPRRRRRLRPCLVGAGDRAAASACRSSLIVLNNQILGYQKHAEDVMFGAHTDAVDFPPVDHAAIARACGLRGCRVENPADYAAALAEAAAARETTVIDVIVDPEAYPPISSFEGKLPLSPTLREQSGA